MYDIIQKHYEAAYPLLVKRMSFKAGSVEAAEDIVQTAYERALRYHKSCDPANFPQWFSRLIKNALFDYKNAEKGYTNIDFEWEDAGSIGCPHYPQQIMQEVHKLIATKPPEQQEVLQLYVQQDYRAIDISKITDHTYSKCHHIIERFRDELKRLYKE